MRIAFVVQRCGNEVNGGAESHCLQVAQRLAAFCETDVLTTCALDYGTWENFYPPGPERNGDTTIRRFPVDQPRATERFDELSRKFFADPARASLQDQEEWMRAQGPLSTDLLSYLERERENYDAFIFFGYLYATTWFGLPLVRERALLAPLAHDEWTLYLTMWDQLFSVARGFVFNSAAEMEILQTRFRELPLPGKVVGVGVEAPPAVDPSAFRERYGLTEPFLLYVGRIEKAKGCATLFEYFIEARRQGAIAHKLLTIGREMMPVPFHDEIIHLGFVSNTERWEAMASCDWLVIPSPNESLSLVLLEAWSQQRPALVNGNCAVLRAQCAQSDGGLCYESYDEWLAALRETTPRRKIELGVNGNAFVRQNYSWRRVEKDLLSLLDQLVHSRATVGNVDFALPLTATHSNSRKTAHVERESANR